MADPQQVIRILRYRGVTVRLDGDRLVAAPRHLLDAELRRLIARFKPELIAHSSSGTRAMITFDIADLDPDQRADVEQIVTELRQGGREAMEAWRADVERNRDLSGDERMLALLALHLATEEAA